jgi:hypothetical protein
LARLIGERAVFVNRTGAARRSIRDAVANATRQADFTCLMAPDRRCAKASNTSLSRFEAFAILKAQLSSVPETYTGSRVLSRNKLQIKEIFLKALAANLTTDGAAARI